MPFDTTYFVTTHIERISGTIILQGGKDTSITLGPWQLPSQLDSALAGNDSTVRAMQRALARDIQDGKQYVPGNTFIFIFISIFVVIFLKARQNVRSIGPATNRFYSTGEKNTK